MWTAVRSVVDVETPATHNKMSLKVGHLALPTHLPCFSRDTSGWIRILEKKLFSPDLPQRIYERGAKPSAAK